MIGRSTWSSKAPDFSQTLTQWNLPPLVWAVNFFPKASYSKFDFKDFQLILGGLNSYYAEYIMRNAGLDEAQAGIKIGGRNINNLRYVDDTTLMAESKVELN